MFIQYLTTGVKKMKSRIETTFEKLKNENKKALITYITCGDPNLETTTRLVLAMEKAGADIVELGIPFSDPLADGPVIQRASQRALSSGSNIDTIFEAMTKLREKTDIPLSFLMYYNSIFSYGIEKFLNKFNGLIDGLIIPDLPLEERNELKELLNDYPIDLIPLVAPTSKSRIEQIVQGASGFVYCVSSLGVTGKRTGFNSNLDKFINEVKKYTSMPLAIGFGISNEDDIKNLKHLSDGLIVGSAIIQKIEENLEKDTIVEEVFNFTKQLKSAL